MTSRALPREQDVRRELVGLVALHVRREMAGLVALHVRRELAAPVVVATQQFVANNVTEQRFFSGGCSVTNDNCLAFEDDFVVHQSRIVGGPRTTPATSLNLHFGALVGDFEHAAGSVKEQSAKVGDQAEGIYIDTEVINDRRQLVALLGGIELHLITHQEVEWHVLAGEGNEAWSPADIDSR